MRWAQSSGKKLVSRDGRQIQVGFSFILRRVNCLAERVTTSVWRLSFARERRDGRCGEFGMPRNNEVVAEGIDKLLSDFITAGANGRSNTRDQALRA